MSRRRLVQAPACTAAQGAGGSGSNALRPPCRPTHLWLRQRAEMAQQRRVVAPERAGWGGRRRSGGGAAATRAIQRASMQAARRGSQPSQLAKRQPAPRPPQAGCAHDAPLPPLQGNTDGSAQCKHDRDSMGRSGCGACTGHGWRQQRLAAAAWPPPVLLSSSHRAFPPLETASTRCMGCIACTAMDQAVCLSPRRWSGTCRWAAAAATAAEVSPCRRVPVTASTCFQVNCKHSIIT